MSTKTHPKDSYATTGDRTAEILQNVERLRQAVQVVEELIVVGNFNRAANNVGPVEMYCRFVGVAVRAAAEGKLCGDSEGEITGLEATQCT